MAAIAALWWRPSQADADEKPEDAVTVVSHNKSKPFGLIHFFSFWGEAVPQVVKFFLLGSLK